MHSPFVWQPKWCAVLVFAISFDSTFSIFSLALSVTYSARPFHMLGALFASPPIRSKCFPFGKVAHRNTRTYSTNTIRKYVYWNVDIIRARWFEFILPTTAEYVCGARKLRIDVCLSIQLKICASKWTLPLQVFRFSVLRPKPLKFTVIASRFIANKYHIDALIRPDFSTLPNSVLFYSFDIIFGTNEKRTTNQTWVGCLKAMDKK